MVSELRFLFDIRYESVWGVRKEYKRGYFILYI